MFKFKWFLTIFAVAFVIFLVVFSFVPNVKVEASGTVAISFANDAPQLDIISISDIPAYGVIEPSGCGEFKGRVKLRIDCFLKPESSYYLQYGGAYVPVVPPEGYTGKVDPETGEPLDWDDYNKWWDSLPTVWQENPFHSHFIYYDTSVLDDSIKSKIVSVTEYFYSFHTYCWDNDYTFLSQWVKVPKQAGTVRDVFIAGDSSPPNKTACEDKATDILTRLPDFDTRQFGENPSPEPPLNIGEKGTIDVGSAVTDRASFASLHYTSSTIRTYVDANNPANADGTIDTVTTWFTHADQDSADVRVGTFIDNGSNSLTCRDAESIGSPSAGENAPVTGLSIDIITGDFIGADAVNVTPSDAYVTLERDFTASTSGYYVTGTYCVKDAETTFSASATMVISLYGTGTEAGGEPDISNTPSTWAIGAVATSTDYWADGSEPSWPLDDGECHFAVTNNSGAAVDIDIKATNFTGGVGWTLSSSAGENIVVLKAGVSGVANEGAFTTLTTGDQSFISSLADSSTEYWESMLESATSHTDGVQKTSTITLTASLS